MNVFRHDDRYVIALTYGVDAQRVRNVLAARRCSVDTRRKRIELVEPEIVHDPARTLVPLPVLLILSAVDVSDFMLLRVQGMKPDKGK